MNLSHILDWLWETLGFTSAPAIETSKIKPSFPSSAPADVSASSANTPTHPLISSNTLVDTVEATASHSTSTFQDSLWSSLLSQCTPENLLLAGCVLVLGGGLYGFYRWYTQPPTGGTTPVAPSDVPATPVVPGDVPVPLLSDVPSEALPSSTASFPSTGPVESTSTFQDSLWSSLLSQCTTENLLLGGFVLGLLGVLGSLYWWFSVPPARRTPIVEMPTEPDDIMGHGAPPASGALIAEPLVMAPPVGYCRLSSEALEGMEIPRVVFSKDIVLRIIDYALASQHHVLDTLSLPHPKHIPVALSYPTEECMDQLTSLLNAQHYNLNHLRRCASLFAAEQSSIDDTLLQQAFEDIQHLRAIREFFEAQGEEFFTGCSRLAQYLLVNEYKLLGTALSSYNQALIAGIATQAMATEAPVEAVLAPLLQSSQSLLLTVLLSLGLLRCTGSRRLSAPRVTLSLGGLGLSLATTTLLLSLGQTLLLSLVAAAMVRLVVVLLLRRRCAWFRQT